MLALYRYLLAIMVTCGHLWKELMWWQGIYAIFCFFLISGYLMSLVLNEVYTEKGGTPRYLVNRVLRIYPPYLLALLLTVIVVMLLPDALKQAYGYGFVIGDFVRVPQGLYQWFSNLTLIYGVSSPLAVSQAWSLQVELVYYLAMILLVRSPRVVVAWFAISIIYVLYQNHADALFWERYSTILGTSIAFSSGSLVYHMQRRMHLHNWHLPLATLLYAAHVALAPEIWGFPRDSAALDNSIWKGSLGLYTNLSLGAYLLYSIVSCKDFGGRLYAMCSYLGKITYAIFLLHWLVAVVVMSTGIAFADKLLLLPVTFVLLHVTAAAVLYFLEQPINHRFRDRVRGSRHPGENNQLT